MPRGVMRQRVCASFHALQVGCPPRPAIRRRLGRAACISRTMNGCARLQCRQEAVTWEGRAFLERAGEAGGLVEGRVT